MAVSMKALSISLLTAALVSSLSTSALAAPKKILIPAPPPTAGVPAQAAPAAKPAAATPAAPDFVAISAPATYSARTTAPQRFTNDIVLKPFQDKLQLRMIVNNGQQGAAPFSWFRMKVNGELLLTEQSMKGKRNAVIDVTGSIPAGASQIVLDAGGTPGATLNYQLVTLPLKITAVEPKAVSPGDTIIVRGTNFPTDAQQVNAIANDSVADVISTSPTAMKIKLPDVLKGGAVNLSIEATGLPPAQVALNASGSAAPFISGTSSWAAQAGQQLTIRGKFFSKNPTQNQVFFGAVTGQVVTADDKSLTVVVPQLPGNNISTVPLTVVSNGKKSTNSVSFQFGRSATDASYVTDLRTGGTKFGADSNGTGIRQGAAGADTQNSSQARNVTSSSAGYNAEAHSSSQAGNQSTFPSSDSQSGGFTFRPIE
jgi:hypothetical protein